MVQVVYTEAPAVKSNLRTLNADEVRKAIMEWPGLYEDVDGEQFMGMPVSKVPSQLIVCGWKNVSHLDHSEFEKMGLGIRLARYIGGVHKKRFCDVVFAAPPLKEKKVKFDFHALVNQTAHLIDADSDKNEVTAIVQELGYDKKMGEKVAKELGR